MYQRESFRVMVSTDDLGTKRRGLAIKFSHPSLSHIFGNPPFRVVSSFRFLFQNAFLMRIRGCAYHGGT